MRHRRKLLTITAKQPEQRQHHDHEQDIRTDRHLALSRAAGCHTRSQAPPARSSYRSRAFARTDRAFNNRTTPAWFNSGRNLSCASGKACCFCAGLTTSLISVSSRRNCCSTPGRPASISKYMMPSEYTSADSDRPEPRLSAMIFRRGIGRIQPGKECRHAARRAYRPSPATSSPDQARSAASGLRGRHRSAPRAATGSDATASRHNRRMASAITPVTQAAS